MTANNAFKRSRLMMAQIAAMLKVGLTGFRLLEEVHKLGEYKSRGHGGKHKANGKHIKCRKKMLNQRSKYQPHQGKREIARRAERMAN